MAGSRSSPSRPSSGPHPTGPSARSSWEIARVPSATTLAALTHDAAGAPAGRGGSFSAGSPRVIIFLWSVDDESARAFMVVFYRKMVGEGLAAGAALRAVQRERLRAPARRRTPITGRPSRSGDFLDRSKAVASGRRTVVAFASQTTTNGCEVRAEPSGIRAPGRTAAALALVSFAALGYEITLTRVFSFTTWYHFVYLIIGIALLGYGAAGSFLTLRGRAGGALLSGATALFSLGGIAAVLLLGRSGFDPASLFLEPGRQIGRLVLDILILIPPFLGAGTAIGGIVARHGSDIGRLYFCDLLGAALGCLATPFLLGFLGAPALAGLLALAAAAAGFLLTERPRHVLAPATATLLSVMFLGLIAIRGEPEFTLPKTKPLQLVRDAGVRSDYHRWSALPRVDVTESRNMPLWGFGGALSPGMTGWRWETRGIFQDGSAPSALLRLHDRSEVGKLPFLGGYLQGAAFRLRPAGSVMVIGVGGGIDVLLALHHGCRRVVGVELNPTMATLLTGRYRDYTGDIFRDPRVELVTSEGRHFLSLTREQFDVIQLSGVDTFAALSSGAFALAEAYLYTVEAQLDFFARLRPGGILSYSRFEFDPPRETIRNVSNMIEALRRRGIDDVRERFIVVAGGDGADSMVKPDGFTREEREAARRSARELGFRLLYDPDQDAGGPYDRLIRADAAGRRDFLRGYRYEISPVTDERPFFFQYFKPGNLFQPGTNWRLDWPNLVPTALLALVISLVLLGFLAAVLILAPVTARATAFAGVRRSAVFLYFAALGLAFLFVEIALMQRLTVFLGNPTYSLSVVLFALLSSSAVGSGLTRRLERRWTLLALPAVLAVYLFGLGPAIRALLGFPLPARIAATVAILFPLGFLLGTAFPLGVRRVSAVASGLVPWAFAVNACFTVLGSALTVLLALLLGFRLPLAAAALLYLSAAWALPRFQAGESRGP